MTSDALESRLKLVLVEDHRFFREGLRGLLEEQGYAIVGEAATAREGVRVAAEARPDVVVLDIGLPGGSGLAAIGDILEAAPGVKVLMLTMSAAKSDVLEALSAGASGYLLKDAPVAEMLAGIEAVAQGDATLSPPVAAKLAEHVRRRAADDTAHPDPDPVELSERELEVLRHIVAGHDNAEIAGALFVSLSTVKALVSSVLVKLGADNRVQAAVSAVRRGLA